MEASARDRLLAAAARLYAKHGYSGATTRRIADEAGVNEVTLFRLFGSKEALVEQAIHAQVLEELTPLLPHAPEDPEGELARWCRAQIETFRASRNLLRKCFAEAGDHPELISEATRGMLAAGAVLGLYVNQLYRFGFVSARAERNAAVAMLMSALLSDALGRDDLAQIYSVDRADAPAMYARIFLRALGADLHGAGTQ
jgi:AcrR family transcriptional regulator